MSLTETNSNWKLFTSFINFSLFPSPSQLKGHPQAFSQIILHVLVNFLFYGFIIMIYHNHVLTHHLSTIIPFMFLLIHYILVLISDMISLRDGITQDLVWFIGTRPKAVYQEYQPIFRSVNEFKGYRRYHYYNQDKVEYCTFCHEEYNEDPTASQILLACGHRYHKDCFIPWEIERIRSIPRKKKRCPSCKVLYSKKSMQYDFNPNYFKETDFYYSFPDILFKIENYVGFVGHYTGRFIKFMEKKWILFAFIFLVKGMSIF